MNPDLTTERMKAPERMKNPDVIKWRGLLLHRKNVLVDAEKSLRRHALEELSPIETGELSQIRLHPADLASDTQEVETLGALSSKFLKNIQAIEEAEARLERGEFGVCLSCKKSIPEGRLKLVPEALYCQECQAEVELKQRTQSAETSSPDLLEKNILDKTLKSMALTKVGEFMRIGPVAVNQNESLDAAVALLLEHNFRHLPVVDNRGDLQGIISDRDLLRVVIRVRPWRLFDRNNTSWGKRLVRDVMTKTPETASYDTELAEAGAIMLENKISCLPVVEGTRLVGILTESDFVKLLSVKI